MCIRRVAYCISLIRRIAKLVVGLVVRLMVRLVRLTDLVVRIKLVLTSSMLRGVISRDSASSGNVGLLKAPDGCVSKLIDRGESLLTMRLSGLSSGGSVRPCSLDRSSLGRTIRIR